VEGATETKLAATSVTTTTEPVIKDGNPAHSCPGTNAIGALQLATAGNWSSGKWFGGELVGGKFIGLGYEVATILGESHAFESGAFWDFWYDNREATEGPCEHELQPGDQILVFPCPEVAKECVPLGVEAPSSAGVGEELQVTVRKYNPKGEGSPVAGASITGAAAPVLTDPSGHATVKFSSAGQFTLRASAPELVRTEATICVHNGNDGTCGALGPSSSSVTTPGGGTAVVGARYTGPYAIVAKATSVIDGHVYRRGRAPRVLAGTVTAHTTVSSASLELRRRFRGHCSAYDGATEQFVAARCGRGRFFKVSTSSSFSYLLPAALAPGRYVLDIEATDVAGNHTSLARGTSRVVFYVR
jgi:hypothetical protein